MRQRTMQKERFPTGEELVPEVFTPRKNHREPPKNKLKFSKDTKNKLMMLRGLTIEIAGEQPAPLMLGNREKIIRDIKKAKEVIDDLLRVI